MGKCCDVLFGIRIQDIMKTLPKYWTNRHVSVYCFVVDSSSKGCQNATAFAASCEKTSKVATLPCIMAGTEKAFIFCLQNRVPRNTSERRLWRIQRGRVGVRSKRRANRRDSRVGYSKRAYEASSSPFSPAISSALHVFYTISHEACF